MYNKSVENSIVKWTSVRNVLTGGGTGGRGAEV